MASKEECQKYPCQVTESMCTSPIGNWRVTFCPSGLHLVKLANGVTNENFLQLGDENVRILDQATNSDGILLKFEKWMRWFFLYIDTNSNAPTLPICHEVASRDSGNFRQIVWLTLRDRVGLGRTTTYGELAKMCGKEGAARAVGSAMANNPISLIVPCHRVIKADGKAGNYSKCTKNDVKIWLLDHERKCLHSATTGE